MGKRRVSDLGRSMRNLALKNPYHDTQIHACMYFKDPVSLETIVKTAREKFCTEWRFRSTISTNPDGSHYWNTTDEEPDLTWHCNEVAIPTLKSHATQADMYNYIGSSYGKLMDESRPLWEMYTVSNLKDAGPDGDSNGVVYMRIHHNIGDGISLIALVLKIFDKPPIVNKRAPKSLPNIWPKVPPVLNACHTIRMMVQGVFEGVLFTLLPGDIDTVLKVPNVGLLGERHVATSSKVDLEKIKDIKEKIGGTVNDVLIALLTGVLRRYLVANCSKTDGQIRALCLINMRDKSKMMTKHIELENQWNFLPIPVPCGMTDPLDRLYFCKVYCDDQKISPANLVAYNLNNVVGKIVPPDIFCGMTYDLFNKCTTVFSNVPGPQGDVEMQGQKVQSISFYSNSLSGTVFGLVSYNNAVQLSVAADKAVIADPQALVDHVHDEIDELHRAVQGDFRKPALDMKRTGLDLTVTLLSILLLFNLVKAAIYALLYMIGIF